MNDEAAMTLALAEAVKGLGRTHPNPAVGAVLVKAGRVISTGFHARLGGPHAEAVALKQAGARAKGATLYSTLEPCNHHGRTPPCSDAIIEAGVKRVVYASSDPNPLVNGKGVRRLRAAGVEVLPHVLRHAADSLNQPFLKAMRTGLPWVTAKAGVTLDGKLATSTGKSKWITSEASRKVAHQLRDVVDVVVVGSSTVVSDDPQLTVRLKKKGTRNPTRLVLDPYLRTSPRAKVYDTKAARTIVATLEAASAPGALALTKRGVEVWPMTGTRGRIALEPLLRRLVKEGALHVLVEGGAAVHQSFLAAGVVDEVVLFMAPKLFGHGGLTWSGALEVSDPSKAFEFDALDAVRVGPDLMVTARKIG
ncbi:MAG: bifunctional diaminohydroxyphosphoribosylaminopyrimidine deaminase/5-amino-6-(5-phosphoribosylamino)uracil reductase RibD [Archangium sp.]|nr:bifunctional diaminohydroxyphosphoribosylaminopyrimidine deaminase/5-amino-6-(5-phosphoribosylamino)uracil reductase RibD [Archangium sp.]